MAKRGFTETEPFLALLQDHWKEDAFWGGIRKFAGLTLEKLRELLLLLPLGHEQGRQNDSPSLEEMARLGDDFPGIRFSGYVVSSQRSDERLSVEGFWIPKQELDLDSLMMVAQLSPDEIGWDTCHDRPGLRVWWD